MNFACYVADVHVVGPSTQQGVCSCGWRGPERVYTKACHKDIVAHLTEGFDAASR